MPSPDYPRRATAAPGRRFIALVSFISFFVLAVLTVFHFNRFQDTRGWTSSGSASHLRSPLLSNARQAATGDKYLIGVGKADITGPIVEINLAGYAVTDQVGSGLRQRLYSRAFIIGDVNNPDDRFVYLVLDTQSGDTAVSSGILEGVAALGSDYSVYGRSNIAVTGTHSHSGPGAWFNYLLPQITSYGFDKQSYQALVDGAVLSIKRAHESLTTGYLDFGTVNITDANLSRSLYAYLANPESERAQYSDSVDKSLTLLRFQRESDHKNIGVLTWFPVHGTSMLGNNTHISGDNKGVAAYLFEQSVKGDDRAADGFVAGFSQSSVGDTTPNVLGAWCDDGSGQQCTLENSTCGDGKSQFCHGRGPEFQKLDLGVSSCYEIGRRQFSGAKQLYDSFDSTSTGASTPVVGSTVKSFHLFNDMRYFEFPLENGTLVQTCPAAMGHAFAAGTTDWPGHFDFVQNDPNSPNDPLWDVVRDLIRAPSEEQVKCQAPKPVLLTVGEMDTPYAWAPNIVDIQTLRVGQFLIIVSPSESTTMSGRRWRAAVKDQASKLSLTGSTEPYVVLGGPANSYSHYLATPEEYGIQRYEGASTLFGPWQLPAFINLTLSNLQHLAPTAAPFVYSGPTPPDNRKNSLSFIPGVVQDGTPSGKAFGDRTVQLSGSYRRGDVVNGTFVGANPRNNLRLEGTYAAVERQLPDGGWDEENPVRTDEDWDLVLTWTRTNWLLGHSEVAVTWETRPEDEPGTYRLRYFGDSRDLLGKVTAFSGASEGFELK